MTDKKNQHYIPKFYLRNFSYQNNKRQIGVFNIYNEKFIQQSKLKSQGSKNFYYGYDGVIEDNLSKIEGSLAELIKKIIETKTIPKKSSDEHIKLLSFIALTDLRNPVMIEGVKDTTTSIQNRISEIYPSADVSQSIPQTTHEEAIRMSLSLIPEVILNISDLEYKLLINRMPNSPFITSDFPIIKYNQYLELKKWHGTKSGYGATGLQIFLPLDSETMILFFDSGIYKVGEKKQKSYIIKNTKDIEQINTLQFLNCLETIYFNEKATEQYIRHLYKKSKKFKRANTTTSELSYIFQDGDNRSEILNSGQKNLIILGSTDCEIKLKIDGLKIHSNGRSHNLHPSMAQLRSLPATLMKMKNISSSNL